MTRIYYKPDKTLGFKLKHCIICMNDITTRWSMN